MNPHQEQAERLAGAAIARLLGTSEPLQSDVHCLLQDIPLVDLLTARDERNAIDLEWHKTQTECHKLRDERDELKKDYFTSITNLRNYNDQLKAELERVKNENAACGHRKHYTGATRGGDEVCFVCENDNLRSQLAALMAGSGWQSLETAPKDGTIILGLYQDGPCQIAWSDNPICMLGSRAGSHAAGWATAGSDTDRNLPVDPPIAWKPDTDNEKLRALMDVARAVNSDITLVEYWENIDKALTALREKGINP